MRGPGTGEASSGLRFDVLGAPAAPLELLRNATFARARRTAHTALTGFAGDLSAAEDWTLLNNVDTTTVSRVEPSTRTEGTGWMLRVSTGGEGCGLVQQWSPPAPAPRRP